ncbi:MAG: 16S rRNA (cytosine(967)-C(5))-methyltransferase RsmB [Filifactor alocis]|nr:16S rRNA (cytosine(967)-C(5))-methyltransferase RsmB [Filifactor alocis]
MGDQVQTKHEKGKKPSVRMLAYQTILRVKTGGAYSNVLVSQVINRYIPDERDRGFYTELVYGTLENLIFLDHVIQKFIKTKIDKLEPARRIVLEMGLYQIRYMDSVEDFAAVFEMVELMKKIEPKTKAHAFINGVLRSVLRDKKAFEIDVKDPAKKLSVRYCVSIWIAKTLIQQYGYQKAESILKSLHKHPQMFLRVNPLKTTVAELKKEFEVKGIVCEGVEGFSSMLKVSRLKSIEKNEEYLKGFYTVQDLSSQVCISALGVEEGDRVLDVCAAPGGKTTAIGEELRNSGEILSSDAAANKLDLIRRATKRLGIENVRVVEHDATLCKDEWKEAFDKVLVDAPCSGIGIIRRKPEIRYKSKEDFRGITKLQGRILEQSSHYVKAGGVLVYSTCTLNREENRGVVEEFLKKNEDFVLEEFEVAGLYTRTAMAELLPDEGEWDGFFVAKMRRK